MASRGMTRAWLFVMIVGAASSQAQVCLMPETRNVTCVIDGCTQTVTVTRCANWFNTSLACTWEGVLVQCCDGWVNDYGSGLCGGIQAGPTPASGEPERRVTASTWSAPSHSDRCASSVEAGRAAPAGDRP